MSADDVTKILARLAVLESKLDSMTSVDPRVRRLEITVVVLICMTAKDGLQQLSSLLGAG